MHSDWREDAYRMKVNLREEVANRLGFTNATIGQELAGGFEGEPVTTYWEGERDIAVALRLEPARRQTFNDVANTYVMSPVTGARVPLDSIATVSPVWDPGPHCAAQRSAHADRSVPGRREAYCRARSWSAFAR